MKSGVLPAQLSDEPVTRMLTGPTLGEDTIRSGVNSVILGGIAVVVFMVTYYGFGGLVASFAVFMNLLLLMMVMLSLRAAFTLPGLAGLVLTIGMAVDANILIYERIRDELSGGATSSHGDPHLLPRLHRDLRLQHHDDAHSDYSLRRRQRTDQGVRAHALPRCLVQYVYRDIRFACHF